MQEQIQCQGADGKYYMRQPCIIWARVMWYISPLTRFNIGKKSEFYSRKYFKIDEAKLMAGSDEKVQALIDNNRAFIAKYGTAPA